MTRDLAGATLAVTGANGFVGGHVTRLAAGRGARVIAISREDEPGDAVRTWAAEYLTADLADRWPLSDNPDAVVHLAGLAAVGPSFDAPQRYIEVNSAIMTHLAEALIRARSAVRVVVVSSGSVYAGPVNTEPITETDAVAPGSPYAVAKLLVETQASYYASRGLDMVVARPFNHIGPGQGPGFLMPDLTDLLLATPPGDPIHVGNLDTARDYTDVRDVASAYLDLAFAPAHRHPLYNVASGVSHTGHDVLSAIAAAMGREEPPLAVDLARIRPHDIPEIRGSSALLRGEFGWAPSIDWQTSISDFIAQRA